MRDVVTIDCLYEGPEHAASYLLVENGEAVFIENNTSHAVPILLRELAARGLAPEQVRYIIITHLHFDHAGGTSALAAQCPNATVLCHPRGVRHLVDPSRLIASATLVYGEEAFRRMYGVVTPIDAGRVRGMEDGEQVPFGTRLLTFLQTPGHARHHVCIHDSATNSVFTGDAFGVEFSARRQSRRPFLVASSAPTEFDPGEARASARRILDLRPERVYLTHYGALEDVATGGSVLLECLDRLEAIIGDASHRNLDPTALEDYCADRIAVAIRAQAEACGAELTTEEWAQIGVHFRINAQGLALYIRKSAGGS